MENVAPVNAVPPYGHVIASDRWRRSLLVEGLKAAGVQVLVKNEAGAADFVLHDRSCVLYVSERDVIAGSSYRRRLVQYRNTCSRLQQLVMVETSSLTQQFFSEVQRLVVLDLGLTLLPVSGQTEGAQLLGQLVLGQGRENPFRRSSSRRLDPLVLALVQQVPGVGQVKAQVLLQHFSSIQQICNADVCDLEPLVGPSTAQQVHSFFHQRTTGP